MSYFPCLYLFNPLPYDGNGELAKGDASVAVQAEFWLFFGDARRVQLLPTQLLLSLHGNFKR